MKQKLLLFRTQITQIPQICAALNSPPSEGCPQDGVVFECPQDGVVFECPQNGMVNLRKSVSSVSSAFPLFLFAFLLCALTLPAHRPNFTYLSESNPSSNFLISRLDKTIELPVFKLFPIEATENDAIRLNVSVNTDDQGVFYTSLVKEYTLLAGALQNEHNNKLRKYDNDKILTWIERLVDNGKNQCFMPTAEEPNKEDIIKEDPFLEMIRAYRKTKQGV